MMDREHTIDTSDDAAEEVPLTVIGEAKAAFKQRALGDLAVLVWDSLLDEGASSWGHHLRFENPRTWIEVSVSVVTGWSSLHGVIHPAVPAQVQLQREQEDQPLVAEVTRSAFRIEKFPRGVVRLCLVGTDGKPTAFTDWFQV
jgi:hypothetical protein